MLARSLLLVVLVLLAVPAASSAQGRFAITSTPVSQGTGAVAVGDFNGDGRDDLAVGGAGEVQILYNAGNGDDATPRTVSGPELSFPGVASDIATGDFNRDGRDDIAFSQGSDPAQVAFAPGFAVSPANAPATTDDAGQVGIADMDGDGFEDLVTLASDGRFRILRSTTAPGATTFTFDTDSAFTFATAGPYGTMTIGDIADGTNDPALPEVAFTRAGTALYYTRNDSTPGTVGFTAFATTFAPTGPVNAMTTWQADGDAKRELAIGFDSGSIRIGNVLGTTTATVTDFTTIPTSVGALAAGRFDGQADADELLAIPSVPGQAFAYEDASTTDPGTVTTSTTVFGGEAATGNFTGDGALDAVLADNGFVPTSKLDFFTSLGRVGVAPPVVNFPGQPLGLVSSAQSVTLTNTGWAPLTVLGALTSTSAEGADFSVAADDCLGVLLPFTIGTCRIDVRFAPQALGARTGTIRFITPFRLTEPTVTLNGTGTNGPVGPQGPDGPPGPPGAPGTPGANGTNGTNGQNGTPGATGPAGQNGQNGATGATGATGAAGPKGATGAPGKDAVATCFEPGVSGRVVCRVTLTATKRTTVEARLTRNNKLYATATFRGVKKGQKLKLKPQRKLVKGGYRLQLILRTSPKVVSTKVSYPVVVP